MRSRRYSWRALIAWTPATESGSAPCIETSSLWRLPAELRLAVYAYVFSDSSLSPVYIEGLNVRASKYTPGQERTSLLRTCRSIHNEAIDTLYEQYNLHLLLLRPATGVDHSVLPVVCSTRELRVLLLNKIQHLSITVEYGPSNLQQYDSVLLLRWVHLLLRQRETPLKSLSMHMMDDSREMCQGYCKNMLEGVRTRFLMFDQPVEVVFGRTGVFTPDSVACGTVRAWTGASFGHEESDDVSAVTERDVWAVIGPRTERALPWWRQNSTWHLLPMPPYLQMWFKRFVLASWQPSFEL